ncbi:PadR family transcriptional regulator [Cryobacterium sp. PAMC25264]|uniref:PadR family transcriptional regulator n=1 Tax=Cryobacterium sp. PAMC25264 TaxID=2861288 RepID=UPI001C628459|nr:PadR family transcriptional regulator [Cryobacterium sp. PAMC25264]QYF74010.1 PadR family transcriptional regulator [Cryobacterium sp. PAMC25264]
MIAEIGSQLRKGVVEYCILGSLSREPMYGWQLAESLSAPGVIAGIGTLYPVLTRLREGGFITAFEKSSGVGPVRKYYRLTPAGIQKLAAFREQWPSFVTTVSNFVGEEKSVEH